MNKKSWICTLKITEKLNHRSHCLDQEKFLVGHQVKTFCNRDNIEVIEAPVNHHRNVGLVERLIQTIRNRLACIKEKKSANNWFNIKHALNILIHQCGIFKQKTAYAWHVPLFSFLGNFSVVTVL